MPGSIYRRGSGTGCKPVVFGLGVFDSLCSHNTWVSIQVAKVAGL